MELGRKISFMPRAGNKKLKPQPLCVGAKVVLEKNLWFDGRLLNGSTGEVLEIRPRDVNKMDGLPEYVLVNFDKYAGTELYPSGGQMGVPVVPISDDENPNTSKWAKWIPLRGAYGTTVHKTQSLTLPRVAIYFGNSEMFPGMDFVSMSRVKRLEDLAILDPHIPDKRFVYKKIHEVENGCDDPYNEHVAIVKNNFFECQLREQARLEELAKVSGESL